MMNYKKFFCLTTLLFFGLSYAYSQSESQNKLIVTKIDSIAKANRIVNASVKINIVSTKTGSLDTNELILAKKRKFKFDGQFLVIEKSYYNLEKLLYFILKEDEIVFIFQSY